MKFYALALVSAAAVSTTTTATKTGLKPLTGDDATTLPDWHPYSSVEDFFTRSGVSKDEVDLENNIHCQANDPSQKVFTITDGKQERCFVVTTPENAKSPMPVLYYAHGSGGNAAHCGLEPDLTGATWVDTAKKHGFAFICGEAVQYAAQNGVTNATLHGGLWEIPEVFDDSTGQKCHDNDSFDNTYMTNLLAKLGEQGDYDLSKLFITGCSMGSAFTVWQGPCLYRSNNITAFSTHSTGLKIKGDGLKFPPDSYNPEYSWGECPDCKYWPTTMDTYKGLKACVFDNVADPNAADPLFYTSSKQLVQKWAAAGNRPAETHYGSGGHCVQHSFDAIAECLDDGTGRLTPSGSRV